MLDTTQLRQADLPQEMRVLFNRYPREDWENHPGFRDKTREWLGAHRMFRRVAERLVRDAEDFLDRRVEAGDYAADLSFLGGRLVANLHGHHGWEDHRFFPELSTADPRFDAGLAALEQDHADMDALLDRFTRSANRVIKLTTLDEAQARDEAGEVHDASTIIEAFLDRHLGDEEDLAVPIILHHRLRG